MYQRRDDVWSKLFRHSKQREEKQGILERVMDGGRSESWIVPGIAPPTQ